MSEQWLRERVLELEAENEVLRMLLKQKNVRNAGRKPTITQYQAEKMKAMRTEGKSYAAIGRMFSVSATTVYNIINSDPHNE